MKFGKTLLLLGIATSLGACESAQKKDQERIMLSGATQMNAEEIRAALTGNSTYEKGISRKGHAYEYQGYYQEGTITGYSWGNGWDEGDTATWEATEDNQYCRQWVKWASAKKGCYNLYRISDTEIGFEAVSGDTRTSISTITMGNAYSL